MARLKMLINEVTLFRQRMRRVIIKKLRNMTVYSNGFLHVLFTYAKDHSSFISY